MRDVDVGGSIAQSANLADWFVRLGRAIESGSAVEDTLFDAGSDMISETEDPEDLGEDAK
jgi:hypothetical protein